MRRVALLLQLVVWLMPPSTVKNRLLCRFGHDIDKSASIAPSLVVGVEHVVMDAGARFGLFNVLRNLREVVLNEEATIESWNWISAHPIYRSIDPEAGYLYLGYRAKIGSRAYVDCSGTIILHKYSAVGGNRCVVQTHEPDFSHAHQTVGRIEVGPYSMAATRSVLLKNSILPKNSILAANSTLIATRDSNAASGLYAGSPAVWKKPMSGKWFARTELFMSKQVVDAKQGLGDSIEPSSHPGGDT